MDVREQQKMRQADYLGLISASKGYAFGKEGNKRKNLKVRQKDHLEKYLSTEDVYSEDKLGHRRHRYNVFPKKIQNPSSTRLTTGRTNGLVVPEEIVLIHGCGENRFIRRSCSLNEVEYSLRGRTPPPSRRGSFPPERQQQDGQAHYDFGALLAQKIEKLRMKMKSGNRSSKSYSVEKEKSPEFFNDFNVTNNKNGNNNRDDKDIFISLDSRRTPQKNHKASLLVCDSRPVDAQVTFSGSDVNMLY